jgi:glycerophosphoryl diester phosphodiesterase
MKIHTILALLLTALGTAACGGSDDSTASNQALVIAHRGASGYLPEHTLAGYELAIRMGADFIEPDLQITQDGALIAMHDDTLNRTTNVASLFTARNGGYKVADFTLAEVKTLTVLPTGTGKSSYAGFTPSAANPFKVPTFQEVVGFAKTQSEAVGRSVGIYPEAKQADPVMEDGILKTLSANNYGPRSKVFIQSFSDTTLRSLRSKEIAQNNKMPLILLGVAVTGTDGIARMGVISGSTVTQLSLQDVASFTEGIGVVINTPTYAVTKSFINQAHAAGLKVHGWTFAKADAAPAAAEFRSHLEMGMDGMFANYPDLAVTARNSYQQAK